MGINFDGIAERFDAAIYGTSKGYIRLGVLWDDLVQAVPDIQTDELSVLDVGGGIGQISLRLAELGHRVVLADPSEEMLRKAQGVISREGLDNVEVVHSSAQTLAQHVTESFDLVMCHAVLEWVDSPGEVIEAVSTFVKPTGALSLMFYNQNATVLKTILRGDFETFSSAEAAREAEEVSPTDAGTFSGARALTTETVTQLIQKHGLKVSHRSGIRIFHDHIAELNEDRLPALLRLEKNYRCTEPFASLAQHIHLVCHPD